MTCRSSHFESRRAGNDGGVAADHAGDAGDAGLAREAAAELYAGDPAEFIQRRGALAASARASGDAVAARAIAGLRKPTRSAWVVNRLVRDDPGAAARLAELGAGLQEAGRALDCGKLRELSRQRRELIATLTRQALAGAGLRDAPAALQEEVAATLSAAVADPAVAAELAAGALVRPVERAGFGFGAPAAAPAGTGERPVPSPVAAASPAAAGRTRPSAPRDRAERQRAARERAERAQAERERAEREQAERQLAERKRQRQAIAAAEQAVRAAERAADAAQATERDRAGAVRQREQQLDAARDDLAAAKRASRAAAGALRDARRVLGRLGALTPG